MKQEKTITVYEEEYIFIPEKAKEFLEFWRDKLGLIPAEYIESAEIKIYLGYEQYDDGGFVVGKVTYERPETDEEEEQRESDEANTEAGFRAKELFQLAQLKAKYPGS